ncbi:MAG TPA: hypothetical protein VMW12_01570 [Candidatus Dormibacteraeota bacterium]|nr:hypothetical protein [Candidatus Dormibacteraeota bacterium]
MKFRYAAVVLAVLTACSHGSTTTSGSSPSSETATTNPVDFPLYAGSAVVATRDWHATVGATTAQNQRSIYGQGAGSYAGHEVIAQTSATLPQLESWIDTIDRMPPLGYTVALKGSALDEARLRANALGLAFGSFEKPIAGKRHTVVVIAIDPAQLDAKAGSFISLIGKYKMLPAVFRDPIDAQAKARTGFTVSEALDPNTPIGAALGALSTLRSSGQRGIVLLDASKR